MTGLDRLLSRPASKELSEIVTTNFMPNDSIMNVLPIIGSGIDDMSATMTDLSGLTV